MGESYYPFKSEEAKEIYLAHYDEHAKHWPIASESKMVDTSFGQTFVRVSGSENEPPLFLLPGDTENSLSWIPLIATLSEDYRTYALDHVFDYGRSIDTSPMKKPDDFVQWLDELFSALELKNINLMGYSYGGWQASLYALAFPERLNKLVLLAPANTVVFSGAKVIVRAILYSLFPTPFIVRRYLYWSMADAVKKNKTSRRIIDNMIDELLLAKRCFKSRKFIWPKVLSDEDWKNLSVPTLFMVGENDVFVSAGKSVRRLNRVVPEIKTVVVHDAGHDLSIVQTELVASKVLSFLNNTARRCIP